MKNSSLDELNIIALSDLWKILCRTKGKILIGTLLCGLTVAFFILTKSVSYQAKATFQEKSSSSGGGSLTDILRGGMSKGDTNTASLILSRKLLSPLIQKLSLQAAISEIGIKTSRWTNIEENLDVLYAAFAKKEGGRLSVPDVKHSLKCNNIKFNHEFPLSLTITFDSEESFSISTPEKAHFLRGKLGKAVVDSDFGFTLASIDDKSLNSRLFRITLLPLTSVADTLSSAVVISSDKDSPNVLEFTLNHRDRHYASHLLNNMMWEYQSYLKDENDLKVNEQLSYLKRRKNETSDELEALMQGHKDFLVDNAGVGGFADLACESSHLAHSHDGWKKQLVNLNLELQLLENGATSPLILSQDNYFENEKDPNENLQVLIKRIGDLTLQQKIVQAQLNDDSISDHSEQKEALIKLNQRLSILEQRLNNYLTTRKGSINYHKALIENQMDQVKINITTLPSKWLMEQKTQMRMEMGQHVVGKVTELVESTIISHNLNRIESGPIDIAIPPTIPNHPKLFLFLVLGCVFGASFTATGLVINALMRGIPISRDSLEVANLKVTETLTSRAHCNRVSEAGKQDIESIRKLITSTFHSASSDKKILFVLGDGPNYTRLFAELLSKQGKNTLLLQCPSEIPQQPRDEGLLQYLESSNSYPVIYKQETGYDLIASGGPSPFSVELLNSESFKDLLQDLEKQYDTILITCTDNPASPQALSLHSLCDKAIVSLTDEKLSDLKFYTDLAEQNKEDSKSIFLLTESIMSNHK
jgi:hypothetical protein